MEIIEQSSINKRFWSDQFKYNNLGDLIDDKVAILKTAREIADDDYELESMVKLIIERFNILFPCINTDVKEP